MSPHDERKGGKIDLAPLILCGQISKSLYLHTDYRSHTNVYVFDFASRVIGASFVEHPHHVG